MLEKILKKSAWTDINVSIIFMIFGIICIARPEVVMNAISLVLGLLFMLAGLFKLFEFFHNNKKDYYTLAIAIILIASGIIIMFCTNIIFSLFRIIIGLWIIYSGILNLRTTFIWKEYKSVAWIVTLILSIIIIISGLYILLNAGTVLKMLGWIVLSYGILDIIESAIFIKKIDTYLE